MYIHFAVLSLVKLLGVMCQCGARVLSVQYQRPIHLDPPACTVGTCRRTRELIMRVCGARMDADRITLLRNLQGRFIALLRHATANKRTLHTRFTACTRT